MPLLPPQREIGHLLIFLRRELKEGTVKSLTNKNNAQRPMIAVIEKELGFHNAFFQML